MHDSIEIGKRIREIRKERGLSQTQLAELLEKSLRTIQKYESGEIEISIVMINNIADKLNMPPSYFIGYEDNKINIESLADVFKFLFQLEKKTGIRFEFDIRKPKTHGEWKCGIYFDGNDSNAEYNADICLCLERYSENREMLETYWMSQEKYTDCQNQEITYYSHIALKDREVEEVDEVTRHKKRESLMENEFKIPIEDDSRV